MNTDPVRQATSQRSSVTGVQWTDDDAVNMIVKRSSALQDIAPWTTEKGEAET
jgi:hypothetical protein